MTSEICECGHEEHWHQLVKPKICLENTCPCKKFTPQKKDIEVFEEAVQDLTDVVHEQVKWGEEPQNNSPQCKEKPLANGEKTHPYTHEDKEPEDNSSKKLVNAPSGSDDESLSSKIKELQKFKDDFEDNIKVSIKREKSTQQKVIRINEKYLKLQIKIKEEERCWRSVCNNYEDKLKEKDKKFKEAVQKLKEFDWNSLDDSGYIYLQELKREIDSIFGSKLT